MTPVVGLLVALAFASVAQAKPSVGLDPAAAGQQRQDVTITVIAKQSHDLLHRRAGAMRDLGPERANHRLRLVGQRRHLTAQYVSGFSESIRMVSYDPGQDILTVNRGGGDGPRYGCKNTGNPFICPCRGARPHTTDKRHSGPVTDAPRSAADA